MPSKSRFALLSFVSCLFLETFAAHSARNDLATLTPIVNLGYAQYQGVTNTTNNITTFFGLRYASPPIGPLRFQAPHKPTKVDGTQNATTVPPECFQSSQGLAVTNPLLPLSRKRAATVLTQSEDCLFLDVAVPNIAIAKNLPVVVWIHGGGYVAGSAGDTPYDLTVDSKNTAITVFIQYRLGAFGFLAGPEVKKHGALNAGLLDQNLALQWVQEHISQFGGDPAKVTIWGESAGAGSVLQHIVAHGGRTKPPLFRAALTSSTFLPSQYAADSLIPTTLYNQLANLTGCLNATESFACLVAVDAETLGSANKAVGLSAFFGTFTFVPVVDGDFIIERPTVTLKRGSVNGEVLFSMTNSFEGRVFVQKTVTNTSNYTQELFPLLESNSTSAVVAKYAALNDTLPAAYDQAVGIMGESIFICPTYYLLQAFKGRSWKGEFAILPANHGDDVDYYFTSSGTPWNNTDFIASFSGSFLDVVASLNPNNKVNPEDTTPKWNLWSEDNTEMTFNRTAVDEPDIQSTTTDPGLLERCSLWESIAAQTGQ